MTMRSPLDWATPLASLPSLPSLPFKRASSHLCPTQHSAGVAGAPHTLGCYTTDALYDTAEFERHEQVVDPGSSFGYEATRLKQAHVRISTSQVHRSTFWYKFHPSVKLYSTIYDLFSPRPWIQQLAECTMRSPLRHGNFAVVHALLGRKKKERGARLPVLTEYLPATEALLAYANVSRIFLQTSTPEAVRLFESWVEHNWQLSYTQNIRSTNDPWMTGKGGKYKAAGERESVVAQAVNAHVASRAQRLSPTSSMWTMFIRALMGSEFRTVSPPAEQ